jgi:putative phosphoesterase
MRCNRRGPEDWVHATSDGGITKSERSTARTNITMKIVIISDIHGNYDALRALPEQYDELWVLGDLLNYGPEPREVVADIMQKASVVVRGNHDDAVVSPEPAPWKARWYRTAETTKQFTASVLSEDQMAFIRALPLHRTVERQGTTFFLIHATPSDPLYGHHSPDSDEWVKEIEAARADVLLVGHSHVPFMRTVGNALVVNPGSIGQPRNSDVRASYAVWQDGSFELKTYSYPVQETVRKIRALSFPSDVEQDLVSILQTGRV